MSPLVCDVYYRTDRILLTDSSSQLRKMREAGGRGFAVSWERGREGES